MQRSKAQRANRQNRQSLLGRASAPSPAEPSCQSSGREATSRPIGSPRRRLSATSRAPADPGSSHCTSSIASSMGRAAPTPAAHHARRARSPTGPAVPLAAPTAAAPPRAPYDAAREANRGRRPKPHRAAPTTRRTKVRPQPPRPGTSGHAQNVREPHRLPLATGSSYRSRARLTEPVPQGRRQAHRETPERRQAQRRAR